MSIDVIVGDFKEALNALEACFLDGSPFEIKEVADRFLSSNESFEKLMHELYWEYYSEQEVPEDERVSMVLAEFVKAEVLTVPQVADLLDQITSSLFLATPSWLASQPNEVGYLHEIVGKMPLYHQRMTELVELIESDSVPKK